jgi:DnaK suppressor protein
MLNLSQRSFAKIKAILLRQQQKVEEDIKAVESEDPILNSGVAESTEPGTDSWMADVHERSVSNKRNLEVILIKIKSALANIRSGKYGKCEKCGKAIERARLEAMPTANLCLDCSRKA